MPGGKNIDALTQAEEVETSLGMEDMASQSEQAAEDALLDWIAPSFNNTSKNATWYLVAGVGLLGVIGWFAFQRDWFSIVIIVVVAAVLFWYVNRVKPSDVEYKITQLGIYAGDHFYPFSEIHSYWLVYNQKIKVLYVAFLKRYLPALVINLAELNPIEVKETLSKYIPEQEKRGENLVDKIIRLIGL